MRTLTYFFTLAETFLSCLRANASLLYHIITKPQIIVYYLYRQKKIL